MNRTRRSPSAPPISQSLANLTAAIAPDMVKAVVSERKRLAQAVSEACRGRDGIPHKDYVRILPALSALLRWWGWIEPLHLKRPEENLLLAWLLDETELSSMARVWASRVGRDPARLFLAGGAGLDRTSRGIEAMVRWAAGERRSLAALSRLAPGSAPRAARR